MTIYTYNEEAIPQQEATHVFLHADGYIAIRQVDPVSNESETVLVQPQNLERLIRSMRAAKRCALGKAVG